jgi:hypothetical protein
LAVLLRFVLRAALARLLLLPLSRSERIRTRQAFGRYATSVAQIFAVTEFAAALAPCARDESSRQNFPGCRARGDEIALRG